MADPQETPAPKPAELIRFDDKRVRLFLYVTGEKETQPALDYLMKYARGENVRRTAEIPLDRLTAQHIIIPVVRDPNEDRRGYVPVEGTDKIRAAEYRGPVFECEPVDCAKFYTRGKRDDFGGDTMGKMDVNGLVNAVARACVVNDAVTATPHVQRRGDGEGNHTRWLVLTWG